VSGSSYLHKLQNLLTLPPKPLRESRPEVPEVLAEIVDQLRARDPEERPASAEEVIDLLQPFAVAPVARKPCEWDGKRKAAVVLEVLRGKSTAAAVCAQYGLAAAVLQGWQRRFLEAGERALDPKAASAAEVAEQLRELQTKFGAQALEIEKLRKRLGGLNGKAKPHG
jgi:transposase-like protein